jgi:hypothetical protein
MTENLAIGAHQTAHVAARAVEDLSIPLTSGPPAAADILAGTLPYRRGHRTLTITRKSGKIVTIRLAAKTVA